MYDFTPFGKWQPAPMPHREITYARGMYIRGENLLVQTPDMVSFANIPEITSRNELIYLVKQMC